MICVLTCLQKVLSRAEKGLSSSRMAAAARESHLAEWRTEGQNAI